MDVSEGSFIINKQQATSLSFNVNEEFESSICQSTQNLATMMTMPSTWYLPCPKEDSFEAIGAVIEGQGNTDTEPGLFQLMSNDSA